MYRQSAVRVDAKVNKNVNTPNVMLTRQTERKQSELELQTQCTVTGDGRGGEQGEERQPRWISPRTSYWRIRVFTRFCHKVDGNFYCQFKNRL